jgi:1-acyl-sn-glycerol-3-phosphate acyltransferase
MFYRACWWIALLLCKILFRLKVTGAGRIPQSGGVILASNHCSYADPVFIGVSTRRILHFLAKQEAFGWFFIGLLIRSLNAFPIKRGLVDLKALSDVEEALREEEAFLLFPEGTRSKDGRLGKARPGVGLLGSRTGVPVIPLYISGTARIFRSLFGRAGVGVHFGNPVDPREFIIPDNRKETYHKITQEVMRRIEEIKNSESPDGSG